MGKTDIRAVNHNSFNCLTNFRSPPRNCSPFFQMTGEFRNILAEKKKYFTTHKLVKQNYCEIQRLIC